MIFVMQVIVIPKMGSYSVILYSYCKMHNEREVSAFSERLNHELLKS